MKFLKSLAGKNLSSEICVLRVDLNVEDKSNFRLLAIVPTLNLFRKARAKIVIISHEGRPILNQKSKIPEAEQARYGAGKNQNYNKFSLRRFTKILEKEIKQQTHFLDFTFPVSGKFFKDTRSKIDNAPPGSIFLLENLRFLPGEVENRMTLGKQLASLGTFYVNDAFSVSHRANASLVAITKFLPSYAGLQLEKEIENLKRVRDHYKKPFVVIIGGAKTADKISVIKSLYGRADYFLTGGGIANTFYYAEGRPIGNSVHEKMKFEKRFMDAIGKKIILPLFNDVRIANTKILDIGDKTIKEYCRIISRAKSVIWNGPLGAIEDKRFRRGSEEIARALLKSKARIVVGGGETTMLFEKKKLPANLFISTGGGAMLEFLEGKKLPGLTALK